MNTQRLSMLSLMLIAAAGWTPSAPMRRPMPRRRSRWPPSRSCSTPGSLDRARRMANHRANPPGDLFACVVSVADGLRSPRNVAFTPDGWI